MLKKRSFDFVENEVDNEVENDGFSSKKKMRKSHEHSFDDDGDVNMPIENVSVPSFDGESKTNFERFTPTFRHFKKLVNGDSPALSYAQSTGGVIIARDLQYFHKQQSKIVKSKQYYVLPNWTHAYNFVFGRHKIEERDFYEIIPENKPVRLFLDLEIEPDELYEGEELIATTDALEKDVIQVILI
jgi:hypothetical protein